MRISAAFTPSCYLHTAKQEHFLGGRPICRRRTSIVLRPTTPRCSAVMASVAQLRQEIGTIAGEERGIFGLEDDQREALDKMIRAVEEENPNKTPTANHAEVAAGSWRLLYTNLEILGRKRVKLAIGTSRKSGLVKLGEFFQVIDPVKRESKNIVEFKVMTVGTGTFTICADYEIESAARVKVATTSAELEPELLERLLGENKGLLTKIFDPSGYLDITYVDDSLRIGRDGKGHVFVLERVQK